MIFNQSKKRTIASLRQLDQRNEIGQLAGLFLDMCREIDHVQSNLQGLVDSRTQELEKANAQLRRLSLLDGLTGIHNRRSFDRVIDAVFHQVQIGVELFARKTAPIDTAVKKSQSSSTIRITKRPNDVGRA